MQLLKNACPDAATLELKRYEALIKLADGQAAKLIVPTDVVDVTKKNVMFAEQTELGDYTSPAPTPVAPVVEDACCDDEVSADFQ